MRERLTLEHLERFAQASRSVLVDRDVIGYAVSLADATRNPDDYGLGDVAAYIEYGASPRGPIGMVQAARALALLRGRGHVTSGDVRDLAADVLRHRLVLSYDALSDGVSADDILDRVLGRGHRARGRPRQALAAQGGGCVTDAVLRPPAARQGPGRMPTALVDALDLVVARHAAGALPGDRRAAGIGAGTELAQLRPYEVGDDVRQIDAAATARTGEPHVRLHVPERTLTTWIVLDVSPSMAFGTAQRLKADVAEGVALVLGGLAVRRAGRVAMVTFGAGQPAPAAAARLAARRRRAAARARRGRRARRRQRARTRWPTRSGRVGRVARQPGFVAVISDFREQHGWTRALGALAARHSVLAVEVGDPREAELPAVGRLARRRPRDRRAPRGRHLAPARARALRRARARAPRRRGARAAPPARRPRRAVHRSRLAAGPRAEAAVSFATPAWLLGAGARAAGAAGLPGQPPPRQPLRGALHRRPGAEGWPRRAVPAWRRHLPAALALAALAALVLALAKPQKTVAVPVERASIMLVTDHSRSMSATDVEPDRLSAAQRAARTFINQLPDQVRLGAVAFSDTPDAVQAPSSDHDDARRIVDAQVADGATATGEALRGRDRRAQERQAEGQAPAVGHRAALRRQDHRPARSRCRSRAPRAS